MVEAAEARGEKTFAAELEYDYLRYVQRPER